MVNDYGYKVNKRGESSWRFYATNKENEQLNKENGMLQKEVRKWREQWKMNREYIQAQKPQKCLLNGDFQDKSVENVIEQIKEQIEDLQEAEEGMQDDIQKARGFLSEQQEVQPEHKPKKRRTGPKR